MATKKKKSVVAFVPSSPIGEAVVAGDVDALDRALDTLGRGRWHTVRVEANAALAHVSQGEWGQLPGTTNSYGFITPFSDAQRATAKRAVAVVGTAQQASAALLHGDADEHFALLERFRPAHLPELAGVLVDEPWPHVDLAQRLIMAGLSTRPTSDAYVLGLIRWSETIRHRRHHEKSGIDLYSLVVADRGLITDGVLLRLFEVEGTREVSLGIQDKYGKTDSWSDVIVRLVNEGLVVRDVIIDATLSAIERDWPQFRGGWYLRLLTVLGIGDDERAARADRFVGLLHSRIPPTVTMALDAVVRLADSGAVSAAATLPALTPVVAARGKGQVKTALKLALRVLRKNADDPEVRDAAQRLAVDALVNDDAELQGLALDLLEGDRSAAVDDALTPMVELVVPRLRARFAAIVAQTLPTTTTAKTATTAASTTASTGKRTATDPLADDRRVDLVDFEDLIDVVARAVEDDGDPAVVEQALAGLIVHARAIAAAPKPWAALKKRAAKIHRTLSRALAELLVRILEDADAAAATAPIVDSDALFVARTHELRLHARGLVPLALPTHRDGLIAVRALVDRVAAHVAAGVDVDKLVVEGQLALLRLAPITLDDELRAQFGALPATDFVTALRVATGLDDVDESFAASSAFALAAYHRRYGPWSLSAPPTLSFTPHERTEAPDHVELVVERTPFLTAPPPHALQILEQPHERFHRGFVGGELATVRWSLTIWPVAVDALFLDAVANVASNLDWWGAAWYQRAYFEALQQPLVTCTSTTLLTTTMLVLGLAGKEPGQTAVAVDALIAGLSDGRVDNDAVGAVCATLLDQGLVKGKRLAASLKTASDVDPVRVRLLVERALSGDPARAPRDIAALLSLLVHLRVDVTAPLPPTTSTYLEGLGGGGQVTKDRKILLA